MGLDPEKEDEVWNGAVVGDDGEAGEEEELLSDPMLFRVYYYYCYHYGDGYQAQSSAAWRWARA